MTKRARRCKSLPIPEGDQWDLCKDFTPSYSVQGVQDVEGLLQAVEDLTGIPKTKLKLSLPLDQIVEEDAEVAEIIADAGGSASGVNIAALAARGTLGDLLPFLPSGDARPAYKKRVEECRALEGDPDEFRAARCKRDGHLMLPQGRLGFQARTYEGDFPTTTETRKRWDTPDPYFDARTQSPKLRERRGSSRDRGETKLEALTQETLAALRRYRGQSDQLDDRYLDLPRTAAPLIAAGMQPHLAQALVSRGLGRVVVQSPPVPVFDRFMAVMGGKMLFFREISYPGRSQTQPGGIFRLDRGKISSLRGPFKGTLGGVKVSSLLRALKDDKRADKRKNLHLFDVRVMRPDGSSTVIPMTNDSIFERALNSATASPWTHIQLTVGPPGAPSWVLDLQHSMLESDRGLPTRPDYTTLKGLDLPQLAQVLARQHLQPRRKRRGRQRKPLPKTPTRKNPMARRTRKNPKSYAYPGTLWDYYEIGEMGAHEAQPVNRRNPRRAKKNSAAKNPRRARSNGGLAERNALISQLASGKPPHERRRIFGMKTAQLRAMANNNPKVGAYWPRQAVYEQNQGPYNQPMPLAPNRRNPRKAKRNPSAYNLFVGEAMRSGMTMGQAAKAWNKAKRNRGW